MRVIKTQDILKRAIYEISFSDENGWGVIYLKEQQMRELQKKLKTMKFPRKRK